MRVTNSTAPASGGLPDAARSARRAVRGQHGVFVTDYAAGAAGNAPPTVKLCDLILVEFLKDDWERAELVHGDAEGFLVRFGRGDEWRDVMKIPTAAQAPMVRRLKVIANLDISNKPSQQGRMRITVNGTAHHVELAVRTTEAGIEEATLLRARA